MILDAKVDVGVHPGQVLRPEPESTDEPGQVIDRIDSQGVAARTTDFVGVALADDLVCVVAQDRPARIGNGGIDRVAEAILGGCGGRRRGCGGLCHADAIHRIFSLLVRRATRASWYIFIMLSSTEVVHAKANMPESAMMVVNNFHPTGMMSSP